MKSGTVTDRHGEQFHGYLRVTAGNALNYWTVLVFRSPDDAGHGDDFKPLAMVTGEFTIDYKSPKEKAGS